MDQSDIVGLFRSEMFVRLLNEHIARQTTEPGNVGSYISEDPTSMRMKASDLVNELHQEISTVVEFSLKTTFEEQLHQLNSDIMRLQREIDELRQRVVRTPLNRLPPTANQSFPSPSRQDDIEDFEQSLEFEKNRLEQSNRQKVELHNLKHQIKAIRTSLLKFSVAASSDVSQQENIALHNETSLRLNQLANDLQNLQLQPVPSSEGLENSFSINADSKFYGLERQIRQLRDIVQNRDRVEASLNEKYQTSFKSVWNVVTMMEGSLAQLRRQLQEKPQAKPEKQKSLIQSFFK